MLTVKFAGAARTVTGSQYYLTYTPNGGKPFRFCLDSGLFQVGQKVNLFKVNSHLLFNPRELDCVVLTHAHLDHCGRLPYLVKRGFGGKIYSTPATREITAVTLYDAASLNKYDERNPDFYFPVKGLRKKEISHNGETFKSREVAEEILPENLTRGNYGLYDSQDVDLTMSRFKTFEYHKKFLIHDDLEVEFFDAGHILGSAFVVIHHLPTGKKIVFSGDLGNLDKPIIEDPEFPKNITNISHIFTETTYGNRLHGELNPKDKLRQICFKPLSKGGKIFIPAFSIERAQEVIYFLVELMRENKIPKVPIFLDSPMAQKVLQITLDHPELYDKSTAEKIKSKAHPLIFNQIKILESAQESKQINTYNKPCIVIAGSGMLNGGRIVKHLRFHIDNPNNLFLLVGYQAEGTLGRQILEGAKIIEVEGQEKEVKAKIELISEFSAHADKHVLSEWIGNLVTSDSDTNMKTVFLMHGEKASSVPFGADLKRYYPSLIQTYWPFFGETVKLF